MNAHNYRPPEEFQRAVLDCPPQKSMPFLRLLARHGVKPLR